MQEGNSDRTTGAVECERTQKDKFTGDLLRTSVTGHFPMVPLGWYQWQKASFSVSLMFPSLQGRFLWRITGLWPVINLIHSVALEHSCYWPTTERIRTIGFLQTTVVDFVWLLKGTVHPKLKSNPFFFLATMSLETLVTFSNLHNHSHGGKAFHPVPI